MFNGNIYLQSKPSKMNFKIFVLILTGIFFTNNTFAQVLKTVKVENKGNSAIEEFQVLASDPSVKHGWYKKYKYKDVLEISGYYKNGLKDSIWTEYYNKLITSQGSYSNDQKSGLWTFYHHNSKNVAAKGYFDNDRKVGIWSTYDTKKNLLSEYNFDEKKYLKYTKDKIDNNSADSSLLLINNEYQMVKLDSSANFFGGTNYLIGVIQKNIRYPEVALDNGIEGTIVVIFIIDENGNAGEFKIESPKSGFEGALDKEALRVMELTKDFWFPGFQNETPVNTKINHSVRFRLGK